MAQRFVAFRLLVFAPLGACAFSTGILPLGPDTYTVTEHYAPIRGGVSTAEQVALTEANKFCADSGRVFVPLNLAEGGIPIQQALYGNTKYSVTFRCLPPNDPSVRRPTFEQSPDVVIEQRNR